MTDDRVIKLSESKLSDAAELLSRAFYDDPLFLYLFPDAAERLGTGNKFFLPNLQHASTDNMMYTTSLFRGAAIWLPQGFEQSQHKARENDPRYKLPELMGTSAFKRLMNVVKCTGEMHHKLVTGEHYYLLFLGVDTDWQGKGTGSMLITPVLKTADEKGLICYLETNKEKNVAFYRKHGFHIGEQRQIEDGGPGVWGLVRQPANI